MKQKTTTQRIVSLFLLSVAIATPFTACLDGDSATIILPVPHEERTEVDPGPQEMPDDDPIFPLVPTEDAGPDAAPPQPEPEPEPDPVTPPEPAWKKPLKLIPVDQAMVDMFVNNRIQEFFWETHGIIVMMLPIGTSKYEGIPIYWQDSDKYLGMAWMRSCYWTRCHGRAHIWLRPEFQDMTMPTGPNGKWNGIRPTAIHEIIHIITGLGGRSSIDTLPSGHLERENAADPSGYEWYTVKDGEYVCDRAAPCQWRNTRAVYLGNEPYYERWQSSPDAGVSDAGTGQAGMSYYDDGAPYYDHLGPVDGGVPVVPVPPK